jgi:HD-GYP domain-containing protein (c-di-GMP phosphodiesterase class II)
MEMLRPISMLQDILPIVHAHHERWDGDGYPLGIQGDAIPLGARVVAIAESFDAMARRTPHGEERTPEQALAELERCAGSQFDPQLVRLFVLEFRQRGDPRERRV